MKPIRLRVKNYRSIKSEVTVNLENGLTLVGPNNSGKTNILKSLQLFFSGPNGSLYNLHRDLPFGSTNEQTSITIYFLHEERQDSNFLKTYIKMLSHIEGSKQLTKEIPLFLYFTSTGKPVYKFFSNDKIKPKLSQSFQKLHQESLDSLLSSFVCKYIPSEKSSSFLYESFLLPFIKKGVAEIIQEKISSVTAELEKISENINQQLNNGGVKNIKSIFKVPGDLMESVLSKFDFDIDDGNSTGAEFKGSGIQATTLLASLNWISEKERNDGRSVIWLIEEPESYLHPNLATACKTILNNLSLNYLVVTTTHSIAFVDQDPLKVAETFISDGETKVKLFTTYSEATQSIRAALGLRFSDFYNLGLKNLFVEGKSDREIIQWALSIIKPKGTTNRFTHLREASILDFSGISKLEDFLRASYEFMQKERPIIVLLDGDEAGIRSSRALTGYFGQKKIKFSSNEEFIILPDGLPIEGLFPRDWLIELHKSNPNWFDSFICNLNGMIVDLKIKDSNKHSLQGALMRKADTETTTKKHYAWAASFIKLFEKIDELLAHKTQAISGN